MVQFLIEKGADPNRGLRGAALIDEDMVQFLIEKGAILIN